MKRILDNKSVRAFIFVLSVFIISRVGLYGMSYLGYNLFSKYTSFPSYSEIGEDSKNYIMNLPAGISGTHFPGIKDFIKFDSDFYIKIAKAGYDKYRMSESHPVADWPFFPLYPLLMYIFSLGELIDVAVVGYILSNVFGLMGTYFLYKIAQELTKDEQVSKKTVIYLLIYPASLYLSVVYTESLFLFLSTLSIYLLLKRKIGWSIFAASLSTVARVPGFVNLLAIAWVLLKDAGYNPLKIRLKHYIQMVLSLIPMLIFLTYMYFLTGDFLAPFHELPLNWGRTAAMPFLAFFAYPFVLGFIAPGGWDLSIAGFIMTAFVFIILFAYIKKVKDKSEPWLCIYSLLLILIPLSSASTSFTSMVRYYMVSFPLFIYMSVLSKKRTALDFAFTILFFTLNAIYTIGYINGYYFVV